MFRSAGKSEATIMLIFQGAYLTASILIVVVVAGTLYRNGRVFLVDCLGREDLADAVNRMLVVGFIVTKVAYALMFVRSEPAVLTTVGIIALLARKLGFVMSALGGMHFLNLLWLSLYRASRPRQYDRK